MTTKTLKDIAKELQGELIGDPELEIQRVVHPLQATGANDLALILDKGGVALISQKPVLTAILPAELPELNIPNQIRVKRIKVALAKLLKIFDQPPYIPFGIHPSSVIDSTAVLGESVSIGPLCTVGPGTVIGSGTKLVSHVTLGANVVVGENCLFHSGARVIDRVRIGNRVILQPNAVIGSDGYSYVTPEAGSVESARATGKIEAQNSEILRINSVGTVVLEDDVEIGASSCVDRATLGETRIGRGTKIDNLVQVAHNVNIGENCLIVAQVGIAGSSKVGDRTVMGGQVGVADHVTIGEDCIFMAQSGVIGTIPDRSIMAGSPAIPRKDFAYREMQFKRLKGLHQKIEELQNKISKLESRIPNELEQPV